MPAYRIGFGSDFNLANQFVGIGTTTADVRLEVINVLKGDFNITGVATLTSYGGFAAQKQLGDDDVITGEVNSISEDIVVSVGKTFTVSVGATVYPGTLESVSIGTHFSFPNGGIAARPEEPVEGTVRFNDDLNTLEFYNGVEWRQFTVDGSSGRGVFVGGNTGLYISTIEYINIQTTGNTQNFGDATQKSSGKGSGSSSIRGVFAGGYTPAAAPNISNVIDYISIASEGNAIDFGDLTTTRRSLNGCSSSTRALFAGGENPTTNVIDYIQINTLGNSVDFGDLTETQVTFASMSSPTRGFFVGGDNGPQNVISFVTIASTGNAVKFGELTQRRSGSGSCSNSTRGIISGGYGGSAIGRLSSIEYITLASGGNSTVFGELTIKRDNYGTEVASQTRAVFGAGYSTSGNINVMDYVTISTTGNAIDFGDMVSNAGSRGRCSDSHGGLGGF